MGSECFYDLSAAGISISIKTKQSQWGFSSKNKACLVK
ncbi:hypothetical protein MCR_1413 [Moraxella catarrhalis BBH18]|nr:hypothetical protein MCR_1413 [Moraxella catarrhalis BBH18]